MSSTTPREDRIPLHSTLSGSSGSLGSALLLFLLVAAMGAATSGFRTFAPAPLFCGLVFSGLCLWVGSARLRYVPLVWGSSAGLDLEWSTGDKRHLDWSEIREIRAHRVIRGGTKRFRVYLDTEAFEFNARADFPELVERFRAGV